ncbi:MAG: hypothetical protein DRO00_09670 [Thermoproteota archaeon]|nr:MAG: hypothetical protein DRO00_09670 [Candidatus Korarchaeota archaeon]
MKIYVVDASVASRFVLVEELSDKAVLVLNDFLSGAVDLKAPGLVVYEVGNTLWKAVKQRFIDVGEAIQKFSFFLELKIGSINFGGETHRKILEWGAENEATYYDSAYVISSKITGATLLTADNILYEKAQGEVPTLHLKDYRSMSEK